jgi:membrane-associated phospholipid phosphatase
MGLPFASRQVMCDLSRCLKIFVCLTAFAAVGRAQSTIGSEGQDFRHATGDIWSIWTSPARGTAGDIAPALGGLGLIGAIGLRDSAIWAWMNAHSDALPMRMLRPIREDWKLPLFEFGSGQILLPVAGIMYTAGRLSHDVDLRDAGLGCAAGHLASLGVRDVIYKTISRARPRETSDPDEIGFPGSSDWSWHSFLSGHVANSMACASFLQHRFAFGKAAPLPYAMSLAIGLGRMADGRHWASDTMAGAVLGFAIGKAIAARTLERDGRTRASGTAAAARNSPSIPVFQFSYGF